MDLALFHPRACPSLLRPPGPWETALAIYLCTLLPWSQQLRCHLGAQVDAENMRKSLEELRGGCWGTEGSLLPGAGAESQDYSPELGTREMVLLGIHLCALRQDLKVPTLLVVGGAQGAGNSALMRLRV